MNRRRFLKAGAGVGGAVSLGFGASMATFGTSAAASSEDYRALVYIYLTGGNDGFNMIVPSDDARYSQYQQLRKGIALPKSSLIGLGGNYAMNGTMAALKSVWDDGGMGVIHNVGTLARPTTQAQLAQWWPLNDPNYVPDGIGSHVAGSAIWQTGGSDARWMGAGGAAVAPPGWGANALDQISGHPVMSVAGPSNFGNGKRAAAIYPSAPGSRFGFNGFGPMENGWPDKSAPKRLEKFKSMIAEQTNSKLEAAYAALQVQALDLTNTLNPIFVQSPGWGSVDPANPELSAAFNNFSSPGPYFEISQAMYQIAKVIKNRATIGGTRHIFYCSMAVFDTHSGQLSMQGDGLSGMASAMASFYRGMKALGLSNNVTTMTASDFGRTYDPNSSGSDHGWGSEHIVVGGAVKPQSFTGIYPELVLGGPDDMGADASSRGRWIPTIGIDQYCGTLVKWLEPTINLDAVFPTLKNFPVRDLGFMT